MLRNLGPSCLDLLPRELELAGVLAVVEGASSHIQLAVGTLKLASSSSLDAESTLILNLASLFLNVLVLRRESSLLLVRGARAILVSRVVVELGTRITVVEVVRGASIALVVVR